MRIDYTNNAVDPATKKEQEEIWNTFETVKVSGKNGTDKKLHIYDCAYIENYDKEMLEKEISVYPVGFQEICKVCLERFRHDS